MMDRNYTPGRIVTTLTYIVLFLWAVVVILPAAVREAKHRLLSADDWMEVELSFGPHYDETGWPYIIFSRTIKREFEVEWYAWVDEIREINGQTVVSRVCGGPGTHAYSPVDTGSFRMTAEYFLGRTCELPKVPFRVCKRWNIEDDTGLRDTAGPACTGIYTHEEKISGE